LVGTVDSIDEIQREIGLRYLLKIDKFLYENSGTNVIVPFRSVLLGPLSLGSSANEFTLSSADRRKIEKKMLDQDLGTTCDEPLPINDLSSISDPNDIEIDDMNSDEFANALNSEDDLDEGSTNNWGEFQSMMEEKIPRSLKQRSILYNFPELGWVRGTVEKFAGWLTDDRLTNQEMYTIVFPDGASTLMLSGLKYQSGFDAEPNCWICLK
jgi:hypothetical protein